jgi:hypothetical protein
MGDENILNKAPMFFFTYLILLISSFSFFIVNFENAGVHTAGQILADLVIFLPLLIIPLFFTKLKSKMLVFGTIFIISIFSLAKIRFAEPDLAGLEVIFYSIVVFILVFISHFVLKYFSKTENNILKVIFSVVFIIISIICAVLFYINFGYAIDNYHNVNNLFELGCKISEGDISITEFENYCNNYIEIPKPKFNEIIGVKENCFEQLQVFKNNGTLDTYRCYEQIQFFPPRIIK